VCSNVGVGPAETAEGLSPYWVLIGIGLRLEQISKGVFQVNAGSLFPALRRLERDGLIAGEWRVTENNRRAKYYNLSAQGRAQLKREAQDWEVQTLAISRILRASPGEL
jgi:PadR family transcriptional regulator PadR